MIHIVIVESNDVFLLQLKHIVDQIMINYKIKYKIYTFKEFANQFLALTKLELENKIYILDIKVDDGLQIIKDIRNQDLHSFIILINAMGIVSITDRLLVLDIISFFSLWEEQLKKDIELIASHILTNGNLILKKYETNYAIPFKDILYIKTTDKISKIVSNSSVYEFRVSLDYLINMLPDSFKRVSKSCAVNFNNVVYYNKNKKIISLINGKVLDLGKKELDYSSSNI